MRFGNWIPISKALVSELPTDRRFTKLEAMYSLSINYDNDNPVSVSGLAKRWGWSRKAVTAFLGKSGLEITYPEGVSRRDPRGQVGLQVRDKLGTSKGQVRFIDSRDLGAQGDKLGTSKGQVRDKQGSTIIDPNPKPEPKSKTSSCPDDRQDEVKRGVIQTPSGKKWGEQIDLDIARRMYDKILIVNSTTKTPNWAGWANDIRLMRQTDKLTPEQIEAAFDWANSDAFWCTNVLSPNTLRRQYPKLRARMGADPPQQAEVVEIGELEKRRYEQLLFG